MPDEVETLPELVEVDELELTAPLEVETPPVEVETPPVEVETPPVEVVELDEIPPVVVVLVRPPVDDDVEPPEVEVEPPEVELEVEPVLVEVITTLPLDPPELPPKKPPKKPPPKPKPPEPPITTVPLLLPLSGIGWGGSGGA